MKRFLAVLAAALLLSGCASDAPEPAPADGGGVDVVEISAEAAAAEAPEHVDEIDLSGMNPTMLFAEVVNMTRTPKQYEGATVTLRGGLMLLAYDEQTGVGSYSCYVEDATRCCQRGIGFTIDHPLEDTSILVEGSEVIVRGTFEIYEAGGHSFVRIADCDIQPA